MPGDSHKTVGKPLALSFWEDSAVLEQKSLDSHNVRLCAARTSSHTVAHKLYSHRPALLRGPCTLGYPGTPSFVPMGLPSSRELDLQTQAVTCAPETENSAHFLLKPPMGGTIQASTPVGFGAPGIAVGWGTRASTGAKTPQLS